MQKKETIDKSVQEQFNREKEHVPERDFFKVEIHQNLFSLSHFTRRALTVTVEYVSYVLSIKKEIVGNIDYANVIIIFVVKNAKRTVIRVISPIPTPMYPRNKLRACLNCYLTW